MRHHNYNRGGLGPEFSTRCILASGKVAGATGPAKR
jgi:hypothetical protein